jgi:hypothetical protein
LDLSPPNQDLSPCESGLSPCDLSLSPREQNLSSCDLNLFPCAPALSPRKPDISPRDLNFSPPEQHVSPDNRNFNPGALASRARELQRHKLKCSRVGAQRQRGPAEPRFRLRLKRSYGILETTNVFRDPTLLIVVDSTSVNPLKPAVDRQRHGHFHPTIHDDSVLLRRLEPPFANRIDSGSHKIVVA